MTHDMKQQNTPWLQQKLESIWYENSSGKALLLPLSFLYCLISKYKKNQDVSHQISFQIPIIVVGNINIGGTGKTPLIIRLTELLKANGYQPAIITRGYKGTSKVWPVHVTTETPIELAGDEAKLMAIRTKAPVVAGANRNDSIRYVVDNTDCDIILSDDGLQHYKMKRDVEIAVIDAKRRFGNGHYLPAGPLREREQRLEQCDFIVTNGEPVHAGENLMKVSGSTVINLDTLAKKTLNGFKSIQVYTGIGNPQRFIDTLQDYGLGIINQITFPDHHHFTAEDFKTQSADLPIIMTEKDAVKCMELDLENCWYLPIDAELEKSFETAFLTKVSQVSWSNSQTDRPENG